MSIFEEKGIEFQYNSTSIAQAKKSFKKSCEICYSTGKHIKCDGCNIAFVHQLIVSYYAH